MSTTIDNGEQVARIIFSPSFICDGKVSPTAFRWEMLPNGQAEDYISVLRNDGSDFNEQSEHFRPRTEPDFRYGYALLQVRDIRNLDAEFEERNVELMAKPGKKLPNHDGIFAYFNKVKVTAMTLVSADLMLLQKELALLCSSPIPFKHS